MKKICLSLIALCVMGNMAMAQLASGGFPKSRKILAAQQQTVQQIKMTRPDYQAAIDKNNHQQKEGIAAPYLIGVRQNVDIDLNNSGTWLYLPDGSKIWRLSVSVPDAKAVDLWYDHFKLPKGVKLFVSNENGRQTLGAYTSKNNNLTYGTFVNQPVQGHTAEIEMDIPANVAVPNITFHINQVGAYFRGVSDLTSEFGNTENNTTAAKPTQGPPGNSATCTVNANCPLPSYVTGDYTIPKRATVRIMIPVGGGYVGLCSGTLINNTGNSQNGTCVPYVLTASHCDGDNSYSSSHYANWRFRFNFRYTTCNGTTIEDNNPNHAVMVGADFKARSYYPSIGGGNNQSPAMIGDFLLVELDNEPPSYMNTFLAGWNRNADVIQDPNTYNFFIGFHHPAGDVEKVSYGNSLQQYTFNQYQVHNTHWYIEFQGGGLQEGSSGSGLFDINGRLIGDLSGGSPTNDCPGFPDYGTNALYSELRVDWDNQYDQTNHPQHAGAESRLKDWLDPGNTGAMFVNAVHPDCTPTSTNGGGNDTTGSGTTINNIQTLGNNIALYPNPSSNGLIYAKINFAQPKNLTITVYDQFGRSIKTFTISGAFNNVYSFNCSELPAGIYALKFSDGKTSATKKVVLNQ